MPIKIIQLAMHILRDITVRPLRVAYMTTLRGVAAYASSKGKGRSGRSGRTSDASESWPSESQQDEEVNTSENPYAKPKATFEIPNVKKVLEDYRGTSTTHFRQQLMPMMELINGLHNGYLAQKKEFIEMQEREKKQKKREQLEKLAKEKKAKKKSKQKRMKERLAKSKEKLAQTKGTV